MNERKIVRSDKAGVFFGEIVGRTNNSIVMQNVRRLWYWDGAASLSQLAAEGVKKPENCKFTVTIDEIEIFNICEILTITDVARESIDKVPVWKI